MHCPRCGHRQNSDEIRFCTKCGLEISDVKELLAPELRETKAKGKIENSKGFRQGSALIIFGFVLTLILAIFHELDIVPGSYSKIAFLFFLVVGIVRMFVPIIVGEKTLRNKNEDSPVTKAANQSILSASFDDKSLPEAEYRPPVNFSAKNYDTNDLLSPSSVTEDTTRNLEKEFQQN